MSFISNIKKSAQGLFSKVGSKGTAVGKALKSLRHVASIKSDENLSIAKMTNDSSNNIISNLSAERQNQILLKSKAQRIDSTRSNMYSVETNQEKKHGSLRLENNKRTLGKNSKR
jgi:hypothetical protein